MQQRRLQWAGGGRGEEQLLNNARKPLLFVPPDANAPLHEGLAPWPQCWLAGALRIYCHCHRRYSFLLHLRLRLHLARSCAALRRLRQGPMPTTPQPVGTNPAGEVRGEVQGKYRVHGW